ncbi:MAG: hypothetical protein DM484_30560 [Candidatus Methylumidiphilus alinenensis]|uniref:Uncharacterized protein n=1 Tax=Candidatus Methylumidiphilus alinenensis TaxID=2202197 RepID=A0A2W4Q9P0_9GAMM|nr:MAG: hypothetical protein DM484_30560 [Candidatus Methylumidiphilus alinenensis]
MTIQEGWVRCAYLLRCAYERKCLVRSAYPRVKVGTAMRTSGSLSFTQIGVRAANRLKQIINDNEKKISGNHEFAKGDAE